ncbi:MAG: DUF262 domain-containing protein [Oscillospiraceae bacterium]|jgi:hypothetical protein|nr:DUF262 domain-containing protein [Oscillospiraceae bacterium]
MAIINSNPRTFSVDWLVTQRKDGKIDTDISIQRQAVWSHLHQSNLIVAVLYNVPISNLWFEKDGKGKYKAIDGKQRTLTLCSYVADEFPLSSKIRYKIVDGVDVTGLKFSELPEELQKRIMDYQLTFTIIEKMEADERAIVFFMGNQSVPLTDVHFLPVVLGEEIMNDFNHLCTRPFMLEKVKLTAPALRKRDDLKLMIQYLILHSGRDMGFSGKEIIEFCDDIRAGIIEVPHEDVVALLSYLNMAFPDKRAYLKLISVPIIMYVAQQAKERGMEPKDFAEKIDDFFLGLKEGQHEDYNVAMRQGSAKKANVQARLASMSKILNK